MTNVTAQHPQQANEIQQLRIKLTQVQEELTQVQEELARTQARIHAGNQHIFTLNFSSGQIAVLEVRGASDQEAARAIACKAIPNCRYEVVDGDQSAGRAMIFYEWCSSAAQECQPLYQHYKEVEEAEEAPLQVGDAVSFPVAKHGEYTGSTGIIAGPVYPDPFDQMPVCLVHVRGNEPSIVFAVSDLVREEKRV